MKLNKNLMSVPNTVQQYLDMSYELEANPRKVAIKLVGQCESEKQELDLLLVIYKLVLELRRQDYPEYAAYYAKVMSEAEAWIDE